MKIVVVRHNKKPDIIRYNIKFYVIFQLKIGIT